MLLHTHSLRIVCGRRVGTSAAFSHGIDPNQFRQKATFMEAGRFAHSEAVVDLNAELAPVRQERGALQASLRATKTPTTMSGGSRPGHWPLSLDLVPKKPIVASSSTTTAMDSMSAEGGSFVQGGAND